jgi:WS/DGAT/MGAT family acyltransferase
MRRLSALDAQMLYLESPRTPNHVAAIWTYQPPPDGAVSFDDVLERVRSRLHRAAAFRERVAHVPFRLDYPYWLQDPDFDLEYHVRHIRLPKPGGWRQLCSLIARVYAYPLDLSRPPWELWFIEGLDELPHLPVGSFATMLKVHHAAVDGMTGLQMSSALHDAQPDAAADVPPNDAWKPDPQPTSRSMLGRSLTSNLQSPVRLVGAVGRAAPAIVRVANGVGRKRISLPPRGAPETRFGAKVTPHRVFDCCRFALSDMSRIRKAFPGSTFNDVVVATVGGGIRAYLDAKSELPEPPLIAVMPISIRSPQAGDQAGNQFTMMPVSTGSDVSDAGQRLTAVTHSTKNAKELAEALGARTLVGISEAMPGALVGLASRFTASMSSGSVNMTITNVPGPQAPLYFCRAQAVDVFGAGPFTDGLGLIHLVGSYIGYLFCNIVADRQMLPDPEFYAECLVRSFTELLDAAGVADSKLESEIWP